MKMYILVKRQVPMSMAAVAIAHAGLTDYLDFQDHPDTKRWLETSFKKVVCAVDKDEFESAKQVEGCSIVTESSLDDMEIALVFRPRDEWPKMFRFFRLLRENMMTP